MGERMGMATESWRPARREMLFDPQVKRLALFAGGAVVVLGLGIGGYSWLAHRPHGVPVIEADSRPLRVKPDNPGGMQVVGAEEQIMGGSGGPSGDTMAPAPEMPQPQALRAQIQAAHLAAPAAATPPAVAAATPATSQAVAPVTPPAVVDRHVVAGPTAAKPVHSTAAGGTEVQLAALESEQAAMTAWRTFTKRMPDLVGAHHPLVTKAEHDGKTFYRLRTGGFADIAQATSFCSQVKAKGGGCTIASF